MDTVVTYRSASCCLAGPALSKARRRFSQAQICSAGVTSTTQQQPYLQKTLKTILYCITLKLLQGMACTVSHQGVPRPFFEHLNYDIRVTIYAHMEAELYPFASWRTYAGFILSCRQAKQEVEQIAVPALRCYLKDYKKFFSAIPEVAVEVPSIPSDSTFANLRNQMIKIPIQSLEEYDKDPMQIVDALRPLFTKHFAEVAVLVYNDTTIYHVTETNGMDIIDIKELTFYDIINNVFEVVVGNAVDISSSWEWSGRPYTNEDDLVKTFHRLARRDGSSTTTSGLTAHLEMIEEMKRRDINVGRMAFCWDLRGVEHGAGTDAQLRGEVWGRWEERLSAYRLESADFAVGEYSLTCFTSRGLQSSEVMRYTEDLPSWPYVNSTGIGKPVQPGVAGLLDSEYVLFCESREKMFDPRPVTEVHALARITPRNSAIIMAVLKAG
ncbi:hypothetical protein BDV95DRAFT_599423 [Massariosphaeria phaeospora]|uniref:Uncharacterized protein n=1 Tax=Massariosphaeria phaeospora TaxID=100035 RepID=A0A7C8M099_9PLEO|nr:hypothetical protein BDV95DRAFT_599423 [Massariosphaeria phaeospora]